jgi:hypothetical protein
MVAIMDAADRAVATFDNVDLFDRMLAAGAKLTPATADLVSIL